MNDGGPRLGLGYGANHATATESVDDLMKHYLQQCLDYHEEQTLLEEQACAVPTTVQFVTAAIKQEDDQDGTGSPPPQLDETAQAAIARAKAIVQKFQLKVVPTERDNLQPCDYRNRRAFELMKHQERLERAMLKNFSYISKREEERLEQKLRQIQQVGVHQQELERQHEQQYQQRKQAINNASNAGIGTHKRKRAERQQEHRRKPPSKPVTASLYLSNLPSSTTQQSIHGLFSSYGTIQRVHFYRDKQSGELKGDGLVVYELNNQVKPSELVESVCVQMNGCELPCGTVLSVEPVVSGYSEKTHYGPVIPESGNESGSEKAVADSVVASEQAADEDDLDDFFASLT